MENENGLDKKDLVVYICQVIAVYTVVIACIYNLSTDNHNTNLWTALLSSALGYMLPHPSMKRRKIKDERDCGGGVH
jgi:hypothetical protein